MKHDQSSGLGNGEMAQWSEGQEQGLAAQPDLRSTAGRHVKVGEELEAM